MRCFIFLFALSLSFSSHASIKIIATGLPNQKAMPLLRVSNDGMFWFFQTHKSLYMGNTKQSQFSKILKYSTKTSRCMHLTSTGRLIDYAYVPTMTGAPTSEVLSYDLSDLQKGQLKPLTLFQATPKLPYAEVYDFVMNKNFLGMTIHKDEFNSGENQVAVVNADTGAMEMYAMNTFSFSKKANDQKYDICSRFEAPYNSNTMLFETSEGSNVVGKGALIDFDKHKSISVDWPHNDIFLGDYLQSSTAGDSKGTVTYSGKVSYGAYKIDINDGKLTPLFHVNKEGSMFQNLFLDETSSITYQPYFKENKAWWYSFPQNKLVEIDIPGIDWPDVLYHQYDNSEDNIFLSFKNYTLPTDKVPTEIYKFSLTGKYSLVKSFGDTYTRITNVNTPISHITFWQHIDKDAKSIFFVRLNLLTGEEKEIGRMPFSLETHNISCQLDSRSSTIYCVQTPLNLKETASILAVDPNN